MKYGRIYSQWLSLDYGGDLVTLVVSSHSSMFPIVTSSYMRKNILLKKVLNWD